jgi:LysR family hydrogen peroxide-inducible transcriptional activator
MEITLRQLKYLVSLAEAGHFGHAAAAVNVSQPALSVQIRELENALGVRLVERRSREVVVTPVGREVVRRARRIIDEMRELGQVARWQHGLGGRLRLGVIPTVAPYLLPSALPLLRGRDLALDLWIREAVTGALLGELRAGALDAAVVALPADEDDLVAAPLFEDRFLLAGSTRQLAALEGASLRPGEVDAERLLLLDDGHCLADQALAACALSRDATHVDMRASSLSTLCRLVGEGFGLTFVPELAVRTEMAAAPGMALVRFAEPQPHRTVGLVRRRISTDDGWFTALAGLLAEAGEVELARGAAMLQPPAVTAR